MLGLKKITTIGRSLEDFELKRKKNKNGQIAQ